MTGRKHGSSYVKETPKSSWPEYTTKEGAERLKAKLEAYYRTRNIPVPDFRVEQMRGFSKGGLFFAVRSNLKNGIVKC